MSIAMLGDAELRHPPGVAFPGDGGFGGRHGCAQELVSAAGCGSKVLPMSFLTVFNGREQHAH